MADEIVTAVIAASGAVVLAGLSYWFTKKHEREAALRRERLEHYKDLVSSINGIVIGDQAPEGQRAFAQACNRLNLVAPQAVITALQAFQAEIRAGNPSKSMEQHDRLLSRLFLEIRRDLGVTPADDASTFKVGLWTSGSAATPAGR